MLRLIKYIVLFFVGYKIIQLIFGKKAQPRPNEPVGFAPPSSSTPPPAQEKKFSKEDGEYIDFEEVK